MSIVILRRPQNDPLTKYKSQLQFVFSDYQLLPGFFKIEIREDGGGTTQEFSYLNGYIDKVSIQAFVGANSGYVSAMWDQKTGVKVDVTVEAQQRQIINSGVWIDYTAKYNLEIPQNTALTVSGIAALNRMKNLSMYSYIAFKGSVPISSYTADYVFPIKMSANSLNDFGIITGLNILWYFRDGSISTAIRPAVTCVAAGNDYLFATNMLNNDITLNAYNTGVKYIGDLKDMPRLTYYLAIQTCSNATGDLIDLGGRLTLGISFAGCTLLTGSLASLQGKALIVSAYNCQFSGSLSDLNGKCIYLILANNLLVTGSLASLQGKIQDYMDIHGASNINGVYTPSSATTTPLTFNVANTGMSALDVANTLIACDQVGLVRNGVTFTYTGLTIDATGMVAAYDLRDNHGWTFDPALP